VTRRTGQLTFCGRALRYAAALIVALSLGANAQEPKSEYQLGAGDSIRVHVFQNPDLTMETRVSETGAISYPLVGSVNVGGMTLSQAEQAVAKALREGKFIRQPQVNIVLVQNRSSQVSVLGAVLKPGRYPLETLNTRLSEMLAIAGGIAPTGGDVVIVTGTRNGQPMRREIDIAGMFLENRLDQDMVVAGGDSIFVHVQPMYYIYGEVLRPGSYRIDRGMTIRQALAQGGGLTPRGTERGLRVFRRNAAGQVETLTPDPNERVRSNDVLFLQESLF
jgi:polysaccharide export outer membrane protein